MKKEVPLWLVNWRKHRELIATQPYIATPTKYEALCKRSYALGFKKVLTIEEYVRALKPGCAYCKVDLNYERGASLDRRNPRNGFHRNNVLAACRACRRLRKLGLTVDETLAAMKAILQVRRGL